MTILEFARNRAFWLMDSLKGGSIRKHLYNLEQIEGEKLSEDDVKEYQRKKLRDLLTHAKETVSFYSNQNSLDIEKWPVINKAIIRSDYDAFISKEYKKENLIKMSTSGSTGTPFVSYQDSGKKKSVNAETLFYNGQIGFRIGRRIIYLRSVVSETQKSKLQQFAQNIYLLDCTDLSDTGIEQKLSLIECLSKHGGAMLMGYSSTLDVFRKYFERNGYDKAKGCNLYGIVGGSTMLYDETRSAMEKAFNCKCVSRYANEENGFLGQDGWENNVFLMNRADYYVEILKPDTDQQADIGEVGRIVVTDLMNNAMPMIRYDTGDVGTWVTVKTTNGERLAIGSFGGRKVDMIYGVDNEPVSPHSISTAMWKYKSIEQYQFAQVGMGKYEMRINLNGRGLSEEELIRDLKHVIGDKALIEIKYVNEIPVLNSGKRRYIVNEMK